MGQQRIADGDKAKPEPVGGHGPVSSMASRVEGVAPGGDIPWRAEFNEYNHPLTQAYFWGVPPLYGWQETVIRQLAQPRSRVVLSTCNESGKTSLIVPLFGLSVMAAFPGATVFSTAGAEEQIKGQLFRYLHAKVRPYKDSGWLCSLAALEVRAPEVRGLRSRWIGRVPRQALTMEGYHSHLEPDSEGDLVYCPVCVILDEAKALQQDVLEAAYRINPDWLLVVSTPGMDEGMFYEAMDELNLDERGVWAKEELPV